MPAGGLTFSLRAKGAVEHGSDEELLILLITATCKPANKTFLLKASMFVCEFSFKCFCVPKFNTGEKNKQRNHIKFGENKYKLLLWDIVEH